MKKFLICLLLLSLFSVSSASATLINIPAVSTEKVSGAGMAGMGVTIKFTDNTEVNPIWQAMTGDSGGVSFTAGSLVYNYADTWPWDTSTNPPASQPWILTSNSSISSFTINAYAGNILFDIVHLDLYAPGSEEYTLNSEDGWFSSLTDMPTGTTLNGNTADWTVSFNSVGWNWVFSDPVGIGGVYKGDLFGKLTATAINTNGLNSASFLLDTDAVGVVPEPASMLLMGIGLLGLAGCSARLRKAKKS